MPSTDKTVLGISIFGAKGRVVWWLYFGLLQVFYVL